MSPTALPNGPRRDFLRIGGGLALAGPALGVFTAQPAPGGSSSRATTSPRAAQSCIVVYLLGGPSHLDTLDLKPDAPAEVRGPFSPIPSCNPGELRILLCLHMLQR